jgi:2-amino-4-hydroxy-6-hydroxymethyldihydropteridine diphosphokinase
MIDNQCFKKTYVALGSNLGDRLLNLQKAAEIIAKQIGKIVLKSSVYETLAQGYESNNSYYNAVVCVETQFLPEEVMTKLLKIEDSLGRIRTKKEYEDRPIDLDFIMLDSFDYNYNSTLLTLPHPRLLERNFVLIPLLEIAPNMKLKGLFSEKESGLIQKLKLQL